MYYVFLGLIIYIFSLSILTKKNKVFSEILGVLILSFFTVMVGLRYGVGIDYFSYENMFNLYYDAFKSEPIYSFIMYIIKNTTDKFYHVTLIMAFITNTFLYLGLKKRNIKGVYLLLALLIYFSNMGAIFMNAMRQGVAVAIFFYASTYIEKKSFKKYIFFILVGAGFHMSALLFIPLYFIRPVFNKKRYYCSILACYSFVYFNIAIILINFIASKIPMYSHYHNSHFFKNASNNILALGVMLNVIFIGYLIVYNKKKYNYELNFYLLGTLINILALSTFVFDRIGIYFFTFGIVAIPKIIKDIKNNRTRKLAFGLAIAIAIIYFSQVYLIHPESSSLYYRSIFSK